MSKKVFYRRLGKWLVVLALLGGLGVVTYIRATEEEAETVSIEDIEAREGKAVSVSRPEKREIVDYIRADGELKAANRYVLRSNLNEEVREVYVEEGDTVQPGDLLALFRKEDIESDITAAQTRLEEAEANYRRFANLLERGVVSEDGVEARRSALEDARAALRKARSRREFTEVRVPENGKIGDQDNLQVSHREVDPGEFKSPGQPMFTLTDMSVVELRLRVPETAVRHLELDRGVEFRLQGEDEWRQTSIQRVSPETRDQHRFFTVFARVENSKSNGLWLLRPGMYTETRVVKRAESDAMTVPASALRFSEEGCCSIFLVEKQDRNENNNNSADLTGTVRRLQLETGSRQEGWVEVLYPELSEDDLLVVNPRLDIADGDKVKVRGEELAKRDD